VESPLLVTRGACASCPRILVASLRFHTFENLRGRARLAWQEIEKYFIFVELGHLGHLDYFGHLGYFGYFGHFGHFGHFGDLSPTCFWPCSWSCSSSRCWMRVRPTHLHDTLS